MTRPRITYVLPFYNEAGFIADTLESLAEQTSREFGLVLVDNGSTDHSARVVEHALVSMPDIPCRLITQPRPGKLHALSMGLGLADTPLVGTLDADTHYPPDYVARMLLLFDTRPNAVMAIGINVGPDRSRRSVSAFKHFQMIMQPGKCHGGGCAQAFRRNALVRAGGFDAARWPYILEDHEIAARMRMQGKLAYDRRLLCHASDRRADRSGAHWSRAERLLYKLIPARFDRWFFHSFLASRFAGRGLDNIQLRDQSWQSDTGTA